MFRGICSVLLALMSVPAVAELRPGLGFKIGNENTAILVPIDIDERFRVEAAISYVSSKDVSSSGFSPTSSDTRASIGIGIFKLEKGVGKLNIFYGVRLTYLTFEYRNSPFAGNTTVERYSVEPTFGTDYYVADSFSVGGEVFVGYSEVHGPRDTDVVESGSRLTAKFFF